VAVRDEVVRVARQVVTATAAATVSGPRKQRHHQKGRRMRKKRGASSDDDSQTEGEVSATEEQYGLAQVAEQHDTESVLSTGNTPVFTS
jgi:hypothetical protein